jgi:hypothetical protein
MLKRIISLALRRLLLDSKEDEQYSMAACSQKGELAIYVDGLRSCIAGMLRSQE